VIIDDFNPGVATGDNIANLTFAEEQGSYTQRQGTSRMLRMHGGRLGLGHSRSAARPHRTYGQRRPCGPRDAGDDAASALRRVEDEVAVLCFAFNQL
jgi:hypothetical protein